MKKSLKQRIDENTALTVIFLLISGFGAGFGLCYKINNMANKNSAHSFTPEQKNSMLEMDVIPSCVSSNSNYEIKNRLELTANQRNKSIRELDGVISQAYLVIYTDYKDQIVKELSKLKISQEAIDIVFKKFGF